MEKRNKWLMSVSILLTVYFAGSIPYYISEGDSLVNNPIFGALYFYFIIAHEIIIFVALLLQWLGYVSKKRLPIVFATILMIIAGLELGLLVLPLGYLLPLIIVNLVAGCKKKQVE
ncbi:MAG: hypothetical protein WC479_06695 [Candidatus Izemoplasmatales bacterium]|jgi:hypothetical protein|nr:hypothetical protein [Candidatus Izemoplasmatales bacterium]MDD3865815.1 hypothetical protein [Candidatus Izemoplasmatales bacterium]